MSTKKPAPATGWWRYTLPPHFVLFVVQIVLLLPLRILGILLGFIVVPLALPFRKAHPDTAQAFSQTSGSWYLVTLPAWAWLWSNDRDGALGDKRGWWHDNAPFRLGAYHWFSMLVWLAFRNPANNMRFTKLFGCPVTETSCTWWGQKEVEDDPGKGGIRFLVAWSGLVHYYGLYWVREYNTPAWLMALAVKLEHCFPVHFKGLTDKVAAPRAVVVQLGFKGEPDDWLEDYTGDESRQWKGFTFEINPVKKIT